MRLFPLAAAAVVAMSGSAALAAQRTFVASYGSDAHPCTSVSPCRSFAGALIHTDPNGEVVVLDSGGYGPVQIVQSVAIVAPPGIHAGISVVTGVGIYVNGGRTVLRGLSIDGQGANQATNGIWIFDAAEVHIEGCVISNMSDSGIQIFPGPLGQPKVFVKDTIVRCESSTKEEQ